jgi:phospholipid/cholesterol/gamma-HCH transport system permease protein
MARTSSPDISIEEAQEPSQPSQKAETNGIHGHVVKAWKDQISYLGGLSVFSWRYFLSLFRGRFELKEVIRQTYQIGFRSIPLVMVVGTVIGAVLTMQSRPTMRKFGAEAYIPAMVAISVMRELSPVLISVIVGGRVGAGIGAELGSMRVTEQIDAMEVAALDPFKYLVSTRITACLIAIPILVIYADFLALFGSFLVQKIEASSSAELFINSVIDSVSFADYIPGIIKSIFFGFTIGVVGCYEGYNSKGGTEGVGKSATDAAVASSLLIIVLDVIFVKLFLILFG